MLAAAGAVTAGRSVLLSSWPSFAEATDRSNTQVCAVLWQSHSATCRFKEESDTLPFLANSMRFKIAD